MSFRLSRAAEDDIIGIAEEGVRLFGPAQARQYHDDLFAIFDLIAANPRMAGASRVVATEAHPSLQGPSCIYRIEEDAVLIVRMRHEHEDWASQEAR